MSKRKREKYSSKFIFGEHGIYSSLCYIGNNYYTEHRVTNIYGTQVGGEILAKLSYEHYLKYYPADIIIIEKG